VAGGDQVGAVFQGGSQEQLELYLLVAHDVRVRCKAGFVAVYHVLGYFVAVLLFEVVHFERNAEPHGNALGILIIFFPRTNKAGKILAPILHVNARNIVTLLFQKSSRYRTVYTAGQAYVNFLCHNLSILANYALLNYRFTVELRASCVKQTARSGAPTKMSR
jgi:hypothetical protein